MSNRKMEVEGVGGKDKKQPKHPFYRNKATGGIYPAMTSPSGYEDKNPEDWEPCTAEEVAEEQEKLRVLREEKKAALRAESDAAAPPAATKAATTKKAAAPAAAEPPAPSTAGALPPQGGPVLPGT